MFVPPYAALLDALRSTEKSRPDDGQVVMPAALLRHLLTTIIREGAANAADDAGTRERFAAEDYFEGRSGGEAAFDEAWYLDQYPDARDAVRGGAYASGLDHYRAVGMHDWRSPNATSRIQLDTWRAALGAPAPQRADAPDAAQAVPPRAAAWHERWYECWPERLLGALRLADRDAA